MIPEEDDLENNEATEEVEYVLGEANEENGENEGENEENRHSDSQLENDE